MIEQFERPRSLADASVRLAEAGDEAKVVAGGTAVVLMLQQGLIAPTHLISLDRVTDRAYRGIDVTDDLVRIGGGETLSDVAAAPVIRRLLPSLARACEVVGNVRIRNRATLAGNLAEADYASDPPAVLIALGATCRVVRAAGERLVPVHQLISGFYETTLAPDELIVEVLVPIPAPGTTAAYLKFISRSAADRPCVGVATTLRAEKGHIAEVQVVVGAVAATPQIFTDILTEARGQVAAPSTFAALAARYAERIRPLDDARGSAWYRSRMIKVIVNRALLTTSLGPS